MGAMMEKDAPPRPERAVRMGLLARASLTELKAHLEPLGIEAQAVRGPETGLVMLRGRIGGGGNAFNLGEATVTRATVRLSSGEIGHGQRLGTDQEAARLGAIIDALAEQGRLDDRISVLLEQIRSRVAAEARVLEAETQATRVDFFTLVRGDD